MEISKPTKSIYLAMEIAYYDMRVWILDGRYLLFSSRCNQLIHVVDLGEVLCYDA